MCQASLERFKKGWAPGDETNVAILLVSVRKRRLHRQAYDRVGLWRPVTHDCLCWSCKRRVIGVRQNVLTPHPALWYDLVPTGSWDTLLIWTRKSSTTPSSGPSKCGATSPRSDLSASWTGRPTSWSILGATVARLSYTDQICWFRVLRNHI